METANMAADPAAFFYNGCLFFPHALNAGQKARARALYTSTTDPGSVRYQVCRSALDQLWELLGAAHQTEAVIKLRRLVSAAGPSAGAPPELASRCEAGYRMGLSDLAFHIGYRAAETTGKTLSDAKEELRRALDLSDPPTRR